MDCLSIHMACGHSNQSVLIASKMNIKTVVTSNIISMGSAWSFAFCPYSCVGFLQVFQIPNHCEGSLVNWLLKTGVEAYGCFYVSAMW